MDKSTQTEWTWYEEKYRTLPTNDHQCDMPPPDPVAIPSIDDEDHTSSSQILEIPAPLGAGNFTSNTNCTNKSMDQLMEDLNITDDDDSDSDIGEEDNDSCDESSSAQPYVMPERGLPWPKLLQYLRESEAASSRYFSISHATTQQLGNTERHPKEKGGDKMQSATIIDEGTCHFCGRQLHELTIVGDEEPTFCCNDNKEFCVLKAIYTRKMMEEKLKRKPGKIAIKNNKVKFEKTAVERALERIRRKQKYEENERARQRMLENSKYDHSTTQKTRMIHFSLSSPTEKWTEKANPSTKKTRLLTPLHSSHLSDKVLETISNQSDQSNTSNTKKSSLKIEKGTSGKLLTVQLTDSTGQYYYGGSGNMAVICSSLFPSVFCYYLFDDNKKGNILGYFDELGRGWLNRSDQSIRFLCSFSEIFIFDHHGGNRMKRFMLSDIATVNETLPMIFKVNRHLSVKYNSHNDVLISLISEQQHYKFRILRKANNTGLPKVDKKTAYHGMQLEKMKLRFMSHLDCFEKVAKQIKRTPLPTIMNTHISQKPTSQKDLQL